MKEATVVTTSDAIKATNQHYDLPPDVFAAFLGRRMKYTCGLYATGQETLDQAQEAKLNFIARSLGIKGGEKVLDIGTGWGSLAFFLAQEFDCKVVAVTPSSAQARYIRDLSHQRGLSPRVQVAECSVYDLEPPLGKFDAVALVGAIEHMPDHHQVLDVAARSLRHNGRLYLSASCYRSGKQFDEYANRASSRHVAQSIFGYAVLRPLSALVDAAECARLSLVSFTDLTVHYERTIQDWITGIQTGKQQINALVPGFDAELTRYLETTNAGWAFTTKHYAFSAIRSRWGTNEAAQ